MKTNLSQTPESTRNLVKAKEYSAFEKGITFYGTGKSFSIKDVLNKGGYSGNGSHASFTRLINNNIENENLFGLKKIRKQNGVWIYEKANEVMIKDVFQVELIEKKLHDLPYTPHTLFVFCSYKSINTEDIEFRVYIKLKDTAGKIIFKKDYSVTGQLGYCGAVPITKNAQEFPAIQSVWHGFDRVVELLRDKTFLGINKIYFIGPNKQMMRRIAGEKLRDGQGSYAYTRYIQDIFFQFMPDQIRAIKIPYYLIACKKQTLDNYIKKEEKKEIELEKKYF